MPSRLTSLACLLLFGCIPDFSAFSVIDRDGGAMDGGRQVDAAQPFEPGRVDMECPVVWSELAAIDPVPPQCEGRTLSRAVEPFVTDSLTLALGSDGELILAYNEYDFADYGWLNIVRFDQDEVQPTDPIKIEPVSSIGEIVGTDVALAASGPGVHHLVYWLRSDFGSEVRYHELTDGTNLGPEQIIAAGVAPYGSVAVATNAEGRPVVAWHDDGSGQTAVRNQDSSGAWQGPVVLRTDGEPRAPGPGALALSASPNGQVHAAYQFAMALNTTALSYSLQSSANSPWNSARTVDNVIAASRLSGVAADIVHGEDETVIAYLDWADGVAEVRMARLGNTAAEWEVQVHQGGMRLADPPPYHPLVLQRDSNGWLHLLLGVASGSETILEYQRQTLVGGELRWIKDEVVQLPGDPVELAVDMLIGPDRRPHIVYSSAMLGGIHYATITP